MQNSDRKRIPREQEIKAVLNRMLNSVMIVVVLSFIATRVFFGGYPWEAQLLAFFTMLLTIWPASGFLGWFSIIVLSGEWPSKDDWMAMRVAFILGPNALYLSWRNILKGDLDE